MRIVFYVFCLCGLSLVIGFDGVCHAQSHAQSNAPTRFAYFEKGPYYEFDSIMSSLKEFSKNDNYDMSFPKNFYFSPGWDTSDETVRSIAAGLMERDDIDIILAMGSSAASALLEVNNGKTPVVVMGATNPFDVGIVTMDGQMAADNFTILVTDNRDKGLKLFHLTQDFNSLGVMYHDTKEGRSNADLNTCQEVARERGFALVEYGELDKAESIESCREGLESLINAGVDAFYVSATTCFDWKNGDPKSLIYMATKAKVMTFTMNGNSPVRLGVFMGVSFQKPEEVALFHYSQISAIVGGSVPGELPIEGALHPEIMLNFETAQTIGRDFDHDLLIASDIIIDPSAPTPGSVEAQ